MEQRRHAVYGIERIIAAFCAVQLCGAVYGTKLNVLIRKDLIRHIFDRYAAVRLHQCLVRLFGQDHRCRVEHFNVFERGGRIVPEVKQGGIEHVFIPVRILRFRVLFSE